MARLTKAQRAVLEVLVEQSVISISRDALRFFGVTVRTVAAMTRRGLLDERRFANGPHWELTDAGRAALAEAEGKGGRDG